MTRAAIPLLLLVSALAAGCSQSTSPEFALNEEGRPRAKITTVQRDAIQKLLVRLFGTPDQPRAPEGVKLRTDLLAMAAGPVQGNAEGTDRGLYRQYCVACHGLAGDGAGPAAALLNPYPRDFRNGVFKYTSTLPGAKPCRADLEHTLQNGIPGTAMPSQAQLTDPQRAALAEYVRYLSIRGETELYLYRLAVDEDEGPPLDEAEVIREGVLPAARGWEQAESAVLAPPAPPADTPESLAASVARGRKLYLSKDAQCVKCHGTEGRGDGEESELYDDWNKRKKGLTPEQTRQLATNFTLPLQLLRPRNFRDGVFHGGATPRDLYTRIHLGIQGTPMPAAGPVPGSKGVLKPEEIWDVVNYVRSLAK